MKNIIKLILLSIVVFFVIYFLFPSLATATLGVTKGEVAISSDYDNALADKFTQSNAAVEAFFQDSNKSVEEALTNAKAKIGEKGELSPEVKEELNAQIEKLNQLPDFFITLVANNVTDEQISAVVDKINLEDAKEILAKVDKEKVKTIVDSIGLEKVKELLNPEQLELLNDNL